MNVSIDVSSYKILSKLELLKQRQSERKKDVQIMRRQSSLSMHDDQQLNQISRNYTQKMKCLPKVDAYQRLKGYLQLQDQEIKRVKNNVTQPTIGMLYPQNEEDNRLSEFLVGQSPNRRSYVNNRYVSESPARHIKNQAIPYLHDYLKDRNIRKMTRSIAKKKEFLENSIQDLENKKFKLYENDPKQQQITEQLIQQIPRFLPQKPNPKVIIQKQNYEKQYKSTEELPMTQLKDKLLSVNIKSTGDMFSSINPLQLQLYSVTDTILQYQNVKQKQNQYMMKALQKSDHNRRQTLFHKHLLYNERLRSQSSFNSSKDQYEIRQELQEDLRERINYNEKLAQRFQKLITYLREGQVDLNDDDLNILSDLRYIILKGRNLSDEDFIELLKIRQFCISQNALHQIINFLFPNMFLYFSVSNNN
ncbi:hypothetical protein pb186bvf_013948 [Paramecium bursaria]